MSVPELGQTRLVRGPARYIWLANNGLQDQLWRDNAQLGPGAIVY